MNRLPLTIIILTDRNDLKFEAALKSAQVAAEVIVSDYQSNNDWNKLSSKYDFKVIKNDKSIKSFAKARNDILDIVKTDWVLFLDSDEVLESSSFEEVARTISNNFHDGVTINRQDYFHGQPLKYGEAGKLEIIRLFKKNSGKFIGAVHEVVEIKGIIGNSNIQISHFSHPNISEFLASITKYASIMAKHTDYDKTSVILKMLFFPIGKFIHNYILKLGFLDGWRGLAYAYLMSLHSFFVRVNKIENNLESSNVKKV